MWTITGNTALKTFVYNSENAIEIWIHKHMSVDLYLVFSAHVWTLYSSVFSSKRIYSEHLHHCLYFCIFCLKNMQCFRCCCWTKNLVIELGSIEIKQIDTQHEWIKVQLQHVSFQEQLNLEVDLSTNSGGSAEQCWTFYLSSLGRGWGSEKEQGKPEAKPCGRQFESRQLVSAVAQFDLTLWKMLSGALIV